MTVATAPTERQKNYLGSLIEKAAAGDGSDRTVADVIRDAGATVDDVIDRLTKAEASAQIDFYLSSPDAAKVVDNEPPVGVHSLDGTIFKVQLARSGSGKKYAKILVEDIKPTWEYVGRGGAFNRLTDETLISVDEAKAFGLRTGFCAICAKELTVQESITRGIGPVCFAKVGA